MAKKVLKVICEIKVPFHDYGRASLNKRAVAIIKREIKCALDCHCRYIEMSDVEKDQDGRWHQGCSDTTTIKVKGDLI